MEGAVQSALQPYLDEDTLEYISSLLEEDPNDEDAREAVEALIQGALEDNTNDNDSKDSAQIVASFFELLTLATSSTSTSTSTTKGTSTTTNTNTTTTTTTTTALRKLETTVQMKQADITTFASGLEADADLSALPSNMNMNMNDRKGGGGGGGATTSSSSKIQQFYANMIDCTNATAISERERRKARQKEERLQLEEQERQRAIQEAMEMLQSLDNRDEKKKDSSSSTLSVAAMMEQSTDNMLDVHLKSFDLPNLRGGGPDLLTNATVTFARGRRYGLMGRNGCGKTTLMTYLARRQIPNAVPKNMNMLLVRQEIIGDDCSAVETVLKSDVKRESVQRFIQWCEEELDKLDHPQKYATTTTTTEEEQQTTNDSAVNQKQKLRDRKTKTNRMQKAARQKVKQTTPTAAAAAATTTSTSKSDVAAVSAEQRKKTDLAEKLVKAYEQLAHVEEMEGGDPEPRARKVLAGLGFTTTEMQNKPTSALSGGWRMRVALSCALFANPSLLLLDEPTNHLDLEAVLWLEKYLTTQFKGTLVVVSHDRHFLNEVVTDVVHFHRSKLDVYRGDITNFDQVREEQRLRQIRLHEQQEEKKAHLQKYIDLHSQAGENGPKAARQKKSRLKKLDKIGVMAQDGKRWKASYDGDAEEVEEYEEDEDVVLNFPDPGSFDGNIIQLELVKFGYGDDQRTTMLLEDIDLTIGFKSRIALLGRNGCGKSTLIKLTVGALQPKGGKVTIDARAKIEYLAQHQLEQLDPDSTPLLTMTERYPGDHSNTHIGNLRRYLANFGLGGEVLPNQKVHTMSGGQKCRLCLALAMYRRPHLLILDEPTNHLDMETSNALIEAIKTFQGGVVLVSHDQHLLTSVCKDLYVVENGKLSILRGGSDNVDAFNAYKKAVIAGKR